MRRVKYEEVERNIASVSYVSEFIYDDIGENKTYDGIIDKFKNFNFENEEGNIIGELKSEFECVSYSNLVFFLYFEKQDNTNDFVMLFSATLEITSYDEDPIYNFNFCEDEELVREKRKYINDEIKYGNSKNQYINIMMNTKFYFNQRLNNDNGEYDDEEYNDYNSTDEDDDNRIPAIIETPFSADFCSICLTNIPNILNFPCLHLSVCDNCETQGRLVNCSVCRKRIERKVKI